MIRVAVVDDHHLVREGIRAVFAQADDIEVVGEAEDGRDAVALVAATGPDVLVMDITMPVMTGIEAATLIRTAGHTCEVVFLSMHADPSVIREAMRVGAKGYVLKGSVADELLLAVRAAHQGSTYLASGASATVRAVASKTPSSDPATQLTPLADPAAQLTPRQREVLGLIGEGMTNRAIGSALGISPKTVERHRTNLMAKLDTHSIVELVRRGIQLGIIQLHEQPPAAPGHQPGR